jgi:SAM-dependent methyltransferase
MTVEGKRAGLFDLPGAMNLRKKTRQTQERLESVAALPYLSPMDQPRSDDVLLRLEHPATSIRASDYLVMKPLLGWMRRIAPRYARGVLVDYGCGNKPYRLFFAPGVTSHLGVDVVQNKDGTVDHVVPPGGRLPLTDASADTVLSTQVLEHVPEPERYLAEAARILKPGGHLILTCPGAYMLHEEPHDYFRYTEYGLKFLLQKFHMEVIRIDPAGGAWRLLGQTFLNHKTFCRPWRIPVVSGILYRLTIVCTNILCSLFDRMNTNVKDTVNYMVVARKV